MSILPPFIQDLQFYLSSPMPCPYLPARMERKLFTRLGIQQNIDDTLINSTLCRAGFRRSHDVVYRPACSQCRACVPVRISAADFAPTRTQRKIMRRNTDLSWHEAEPRPTAGLFDLFSYYQSMRHSDSDMALMSLGDFDAMLTEGSVNTRLFVLRDERLRLCGCMIADVVADGLSAVYSFFDPEEAKRSLGTYLILALVEEARRRKLPYVYLGYWIEGARTMAYKANFQPLQALSDQGWDWLELKK